MLKSKQKETNPPREDHLAVLQDNKMMTRLKNRALEIKTISTFAAI